MPSNETALPKTLGELYDKSLPPMGVPLKGRLKNCVDCGIKIYVHRWRLVRGSGIHRCLRCHQARVPLYGRLGGHSKLTTEHREKIRQSMLRFRASQRGARNASMVLDNLQTIPT